MLAAVRALGFGECASPREMPPRRTPWFLDNGAWPAFRKGQPFEGNRFLAALRRLPGLPAPDFIVVPDRVAGGLDSLWFSLTWTPYMQRFGLPLYLAVQDGMVEADVQPHVGNYAGIFIGGKDEWKFAAAPGWARFAHARGLMCHIGRVGSVRRIRRASFAGADSIDSSQPLWGMTEFRRFVHAVGQGEMFREAA